MEKTKNVVLLVLCGMVVFLGVMLFLSSREELAAQGTSGANQDMIAVTGTYGAGMSALYVIDTKERQLAVYAVDPGGKSLRLLAARNIYYDLRIPEYMDGSDEEVKVEALKRGWRKARSNKEK